MDTKYRDVGDYIRRNFYVLYAYPATKSEYIIRLFAGRFCFIGTFFLLTIFVKAGQSGAQWAMDLLQAFAGPIGAQAHVERLIFLVFGTITLSIPLSYSAIPVMVSYKLQAPGNQKYRWRHGVVYTGEEEDFKQFAESGSIYINPFASENYMVVDEPVGIPYKNEKLPLFHRSTGWLILAFVLYGLLILSLIKGG